MRVLPQLTSIWHCREPCWSQVGTHPTKHRHCCEEEQHKNKPIYHVWESNPRPPGQHDVYLCTSFSYNSLFFLWSLFTPWMSEALPDTFWHPPCWRMFYSVPVQYGQLHILHCFISSEYHTIFHTLSSFVYSCTNHVNTPGLQHLTSSSS